VVLNQDRSNDQKPSIVLTWTSQNPSPSSERILSLAVTDTFMVIPPTGIEENR